MLACEAAIQTQLSDLFQTPMLFYVSMPSYFAQLLIFQINSVVVFSSGNQSQKYESHHFLKQLHMSNIEIRR